MRPLRSPASQRIHVATTIVAIHGRPAKSVEATHPHSEDVPRLLESQSDFWSRFAKVSKKSVAVGLATLIRREFSR